MASLFKNTLVGHDEGNNVDDYTTQYVKAMETGDGKEEVGEVGRSLRTIDIIERIMTPPCTLMIQVCPLPCLATQECSTTEDGPA